MPQATSPQATAREMVHSRLRLHRERESCVLQLEKAHTLQQRPSTAKREKETESEVLTPVFKNVNLFGYGGIIVAISYSEVILEIVWALVQMPGVLIKR